MKLKGIIFYVFLMEIGCEGKLGRDGRGGGGGGGWGIALIEPELMYQL